MRVLHIIAGLDVGGAELMLKRLVDSFRANTDQRHAIISLTTIGPVGQQLQASGVPIQALGMRSVLDIPRVVWRLFFHIRAIRPDIVQTWMYHSDLLGGVAARLVGVRQVIWGIRATDIPHGGAIATAVARWMCARLSGWVPQVVVCAAEASKNAHVRLGYDASKMVVIPNGYDFSRLQATSAERNQIRASCNIAEEEVVLGTLGRFHPDKDQQNFVRAAGMLSAELPFLRFVMVGRALDWNNAHLVEWINATGFKDRFVLLGERSDVPQCLASMDIFCLPSRSEGFPNVLVEAMAMGLPCVATDVGDVAVLLTGDGELVAKEDSPALAAAIRRLLTKGAAARLELGLRNQMRVRNEYAIERARERFDAIYKRLTSQAGAI